MSIYAIMFAIISANMPHLNDVLDTRPWWDRDVAKQVLEAMGEDGRQGYKLLNTVDTVFPFCYGTFLTLLLSSRTGSRLLSLAPILMALCDIGENMCVRYLLAMYPQSIYMPKAVHYGPLFTASKWIFCFLALVPLAITYLPGVSCCGGHRTKED